MADTFSRSTYSTTSEGFRLVTPDEYSEYKSDFIRRSSRLSSTLYEVPYRPFREYYQTPTAQSTLNRASIGGEEAADMAQADAFVRDTLSSGGKVREFSDAILHFKSHVGTIDGTTRAFIPTGNLSYTAMELSNPPGGPAKRKRALDKPWKTQFQVNLGVEITNPKIVKEVVKIQDSIKRGNYIARTEHFLSGELAKKGLSSQLRKAGKGDRIVISSPYIDNMSLAKDIIAARKEGANVTVISAASRGGSNKEATEKLKQYLADGGVSVYTADQSLMVHAKFAAIMRGDKTAYSQVGSSNYTYKSASNTTLDYMLLSKDPTLASQLIQVSDKMLKEYGLSRIYKSSNVTKYDIGPIGQLLRPGYTERNLLTKAYTKNDSDRKRQEGGLAYYPTSMPQEFFQLFQGRAIPEVSIYQNLYEAYTRKEAPQALKNIDHQLGQLGLGDRINRLFGVNLYEPGSGVGIAGLRGLGRILDTVFGHYDYQDYKAQQSGEYRGGIGKLHSLSYTDKEPERGFFEQTLVYAGQSVSSVGLSLASYFAFSHTWNITRTLFQDTGVDYLLDFNNLGKNKFTDFATKAYVGSRAFTVSKRSAELARELGSAPRDASIFSTLLDGFDNLDPNQRFGRSMDVLLTTMQDYSLMIRDGKPLDFKSLLKEGGAQEAARKALLSRIEDLNLFHYSKLSNYHDFGTKSSVQKLAIIEEYVSTIIGDLSGDSEIASLTRALSLSDADVRASGRLNFSTYQDYLMGPAGVERAKGAVPDVASRIRDISSSKFKLVGIDLSRREIALRPSVAGGTTGGLFSMMSVSRQMEQVMFNQVTLPLIDYISAVGGSKAERKLYAEGVKELTTIIGDTPVLRYANKSGFIRPSITAYGFSRQEALATAYEHIAYFVPTNMLLWFKPIRDLLGVDSISTAGDINYDSDPETGKLSGLTVRQLRQKLQGQSLKGLIGSGFSGLIKTQKAVAHNLHRLATNPASTLRDAYNFLSNDFEIRVIEQDLYKSADRTLRRASRSSVAAATRAEKLMDNTADASEALRQITEDLYGDRKIARKVETKVIGALEMRYKSMSLLGRRFYGNFSNRMQASAPRSRPTILRVFRRNQTAQAQQSGNTVASEMFEAPVFREPTYKERYVDLMREQEVLARRTLGDETHAALETVNSSPYKGFRRFMMGAGLFFAADFLIDRFFLRAPGADLISQILADRHLEDENGDRFARIQFTGNVPSVVKYPVALAGFIGGGMLFGETSRTLSFTGKAVESMSAATKARDRYASILGDAIPSDISKRFDAPLLARVGDVANKRVSRKFGMIGAVAGMAASLAATQTVFSTVAHVANLVKGRYDDGLSIGGMYAQFSTTLMNAVSEAVDTREAALREGIAYRTTRQQQADIMLGSIIAAEYQLSGESKPGRGIYSFAHQLNSPIFQLAFVSRHDSSTGTTEISAGFQFIPILAMGSTPVLPLMLRLKNDKTPLDVLASGGVVDPNSPELVKSYADVPVNQLIGMHFNQAMDSVLSLGFGDSLVYNKNTALPQALMFMGASGIVVDTVRHLGKTLPQSSFLRREIAQMGIAAELPYHGLRLMSKMVEFSQIPLMIVPDTVSKGVRATTSGIDPRTIAGIKLKGLGGLAAAGAFFSTAPLAADLGRVFASATGIGLVAGEGGEMQVSDTLTGAIRVGAALGSAAFAGATMIAFRSDAGSSALASFSKRLPTFARRAAPYYIAYAVAKAITNPRSETVDPTDGGTQTYSNLAIAGIYGSLLDRAGVFHRYDSVAIRRASRNPLYSQDAKRLRSGAIQEVGRLSQLAYAEAAAALGARGFDAPQLEHTEDYVQEYKRLLGRERKAIVLNKLTNASAHMRLTSTIGARMVMAAKTMVAVKLAATAITSLAPNALRASAIMAPFRAISGVEPYIKPEDQLRDPMGMPAGRYRPTSLRDAVGVVLDFIGQSLTFGKVSPGTAMGLYRSQPNMFMTIAAGAGVTVGKNDQLRNYMQAQGVSTDASFSVYSIFKGGLLPDLAYRLQSILAAHKGIDTTSALNLLRGSYARQKRAKTSRFMMASGLGSGGGSRGLMMALRIRNWEMDNLARQRPSEISMDFMRLMIGAGYASDQNVDLKRVSGLPINYLGSLIFSATVNNKPQASVISGLLGDFTKPDLTEYVYKEAMRNNVMLADRVPIFSDFVDMAQIVSNSWRNGNSSNFAYHSLLGASIAVPAMFMAFTTFAELTAGTLSIIRGGSQNLARKETSETLSRIRGNYIYNKQLGRRHYFARKQGQKGSFADVTNTDVVLSPQARANELYFVMESGASTRAATIDISGLDLKQSKLDKFVGLANNAYAGMLSGLHNFVSDFHPDPYISGLVNESRVVDVRGVADRVYESFSGQLRAGLSIELKGGFDARLVNLLTPSDIDTYMSGLLERQSFINELQDLFSRSNAGSLSGITVDDAVDRAEFVRKYLASQAEGVIEKITTGLPKDTMAEIGREIGEQDLGTKIRHRFNTAELAPMSSSLVARRTVDEIATSSAAQMIRKQGVVATTKETFVGLGKGFLKLTELSQLYSLSESVSMLGSSNPVERRIASYAVPTFAMEFALGLAGLAALQFALANPIAGVAIALGGLAIFTLSKPHGFGNKFLNFVNKNIEKPLIDNLAGALYWSTNLPLVQPIISAVTAPIRAVLHDLISPTFTRLRSASQNNRILAFIADFIVPETIDSFVDRQRFYTPSGGTRGPIPELYTASQIRQANATKLAARRGRITSLSTGFEDDLVAPFLQGSAWGYAERLTSDKYFQTNTLSGFGSGSYTMSSGLRLAISRRQSLLDMTVYGRFTQRPDETFPALGGDLAVMTAAFKANRVKGGSPFALNKVIAEMRAFFSTPIFQKLGKVMDSIRNHTDSLRNTAYDLLDFRLVNIKGDYNERLYKSLSKVPNAIHTRLSKDFPKVVTFLSGAYNRTINRVFQFIKERGIKGALGHVISKVSPTSVIKTGIGITAGMYFGASAGAFIGGMVGQSEAGALVGSIAGSVLGTAIVHKPLQTISTLRSWFARISKLPARAYNLINPITESEVDGAATTSRRFQQLNRAESAANNALLFIGRLASPIKERLSSVSAKMSNFGVRVSERSLAVKEQLKSIAAERTAGLRAQVKKLMPAVTDAATGITTVIDVANLGFTTTRVFSLKGSDSRREYDAAYKGIAQASVTITAASLSAMVMKGKFAALKIISLAAIANQTLGKSAGDFLSDKSFEDLLGNNEKKSYYARDRHFSTADALAYGMAGVATVSTLAELSKTPAGKLLARVGGRVASYAGDAAASVMIRTPAGASTLYALQSTSSRLSAGLSSVSAKSMQITASLYAKGTAALPALPLPRVNLPFINTGNAAVPAPNVSAVTSVADDIAEAGATVAAQSVGRSVLKSVASRTIQGLGFGAMLVGPVVAAASQHSALSRMTSGKTTPRRLRQDLNDVFSGSMGQGVGLVGAAIGSAVGGPLGAIAGGIVGGVAGDLMGQKMANANYFKIREAGMANRTGIKKVGESTRTGAIVGGIVGGVLTAGAIVGAVALGVVAAPLIAVAATGALLVGGAALIGSAVGAQLGLNSSVDKHKRSKLVTPGTRTYNASRKKYVDDGDQSSSPGARRLNYESRKSFSSKENSTGHYLSNSDTSLKTLVSGAASISSKKGTTTNDSIESGTIGVRTAAVRSSGAPNDKNNFGQHVERFFKSAGELIFGAPASAAGTDFLPINPMSSLPKSRKTSTNLDDVIRSQKSRVLALQDTAPTTKYGKRNIEAERSFDSVRTPEKPKGIFDDFKHYAGSILSGVKQGASWIVGGVKNFFASMGDLFKKAVDTAATALGLAGTGGQGGIGDKINQRIQSTVSDLFGAVGMKPPSSFAGVGSDPKAQAIARSAQQLGVDARDLAAIIAWESDFRPEIWGGTGGRYLGLIQFGPSEQSLYNVSPNDSFENQMTKVVAFMKDRGVKPGHTVRELYLAVLTGHASNTHLLNAQDSFGTSVGGILHSLRPGGAEYEQGLAFLGRGGVAPTSGGQGSGQATGEVSLSRLTNIIRGDTELISQIVDGIGQNRQGSGAPASGGAFGTGLHVGPSEYIGGSSAYHIDFRFMGSSLTESHVAMFDRMAAAYRAAGRQIEFSNSGVSGLVYNERATMQEKLSLLRRATGSHSNRPGRMPFDFYVPLIGQSRFGDSATTGELIAPTISGGHAEYFHDPGGGGAGVNLYDASGTLVAQMMHGDVRKGPGPGTRRTFSNSSTANQANTSIESSNQSYTQAYNQAMSTMDGRHYIGQRFEQIIIQRLKEAGIPQERINVVKDKIRQFNAGLPESERRRATSLMSQGQDPNYLDRLPVDNLNQAKDAATKGVVPTPKNRGSSRRTDGNGQSMSQGSRDNIHAAISDEQNRVSATRRRTESYRAASAAVEADRQSASQNNRRTTVNIARSSGPHPDKSVASAEPSMRANSQVDLQRVAYIDNRVNLADPSQRTRHLVVEDRASEADRAAVSANGHRLPNPHIASAEPLIA